MPGKQVQQATFDAIVREAIVDFGMDADAALADAREQLKMAGVTDFSNIITSSPLPAAGDHAGLALPAALRSALDGIGAAVDAQALALAQAARADVEVCGVAGANGAVDMAVEILKKGLNDMRDGCGDTRLAESGCDLVAALCARNELNRTQFIAVGDGDGVGVLKDILEVMHRDSFYVNADVQSEDDVNGSRELVPLLLRALYAAMRQSEIVKKRVAEGESLDHLMHLFDVYCDRVLLGSAAGMEEGSDSCQVHAVATVRCACMVFRQLLTPDDTTVTVSDAFNRARVLTGSKSVMESGLKPLTYPTALQVALYRVAKSPASSDEGLLVDCLIGARVCAVSDEICADLMKIGFGTLASEELHTHVRSAPVARAGISLLRNLSARDQCKSELFSAVHAAREATEQYLEQDAGTVEQFCGFLASLCLRRPDLSRSIVLSGVTATVIRGMRAHGSVLAVQKMGCLALRNACSRDLEARERLRDGGDAERVVRAAWAAYPRACDELAYCALRDLDVLADDEMRRDERYTMPAGMFKSSYTKAKQGGGSKQ